MHFGWVFCKKKPVPVYSNFMHRDRHVNTFRIVQPVGASKYLSKSLHPFSQLICTSISGCLRSAIRQCTWSWHLFNIPHPPPSQQHSKVPHTSSSRCLNTFPLFFIRNVKCDMEANTRAVSTGEISLAGLTATPRTCVTQRKYLLEELTGVTASANIASDHKCSWIWLLVGFFGVVFFFMWEWIDARQTSLVW